MVVGGLLGWRCMGDFLLPQPPSMDRPSPLGQKGGSCCGEGVKESSCPVIRNVGLIQINPYFKYRLCWGSTHAYTYTHTPDEEAALVSGLARKLLPSHETLVDQTHADSYSDGEGLFMIYDCSSRSSPWLWSGFGGFCSPHLELFERVASS
ncbi:hypothetical protein ASPFODRAFT_295217 [Aspergillus luchuensis CBS 106.47]|uniref:Uncharacterized protein n=1 Tax=Aspergillus luchuensis (strain CBS 106.47) TaxID=1137211 RepID=A0A1M3TB34_ASPLC|nr:hypothetical protein ASPFODRAFT_295217 [Aspergillus luchuensis CBS 106.47]